MEGRGGDYSHGIYTMPQLAHLCLEFTIYHYSDRKSIEQHFEDAVNMRSVH